jgi:hypothetical protein
MPMRATTVRFSEDLWSLLEGEASEQGISAAQFVRDAAILRLGMLSGRRGDHAAALTLEDLAAGALAGRAGPAPSGGIVADPLRLAALNRTGLLDSAPEPAFDRLANLARRLLNAPVALISLVGRDRQFFKSCPGLAEPFSSAREAPLSHSFCRHTLESRESLVVEDARAHPLVRDNPAVQDFDAIAYAGSPLITGDGHVLGALCVIDHQPRSWTTDQIDTLEVLGGSVVAEIELACGRLTA